MLGIRSKVHSEDIPKHSKPLGALKQTARRFEQFPSLVHLLEPRPFSKLPDYLANGLPKISLRPISSKQTLA